MHNSRPDCHAQGRCISGADMLADEIACIDLGFSEKRYNRVIEFVPAALGAALLARQQAAFGHIASSAIAQDNRRETLGSLLGTRP